MKRVLAFGFLLCLSATAWADVDHACLNKCVANSTASSVCLSQCTYGATAPAAKAGATSHRVLETPVPVGGVQSKPRKAAPVVRDTDHVCLNQCLQDGMAYGLCQDRCDKTALSKGKGSVAAPSSGATK